MATIMLKGGTVVDGSGAPGFPADVLLADGSIRRISSDEALPAADAVLDCTGKVVAPGFVDMHSHIDFLMPSEQHEQLVASFLEQGVTTVVAGNCGLSPGPLDQVTRQRLESHASVILDHELDWSWGSLGEYLDLVDASRPAVNIAQLVGHAALRFAGSKVSRGNMGASDLRRCLSLAEEALDEGACGLSFGLGYDPGMYSSLEELEAFCGVAAKHDKPVTSHLKAYSRVSPCYPLSYWRAHNLRALREMLDVTRRAGARLQASHFIFVGRKTWSTAREALGMIDDARRSQDVMIDAFPYTCGNTTINATLPFWFLALGDAGYNNRLALLRLRAELAIGYRLVGFEWGDFQVMEIGVAEWSHLNGQTLAELGHAWSTTPFDAFLRVAKRSRGGALMLLHSYSGDREGNGPIEDVLTHEACLYETDAIVRSDGWPNPAAVGTFPKILADQVRRRKRLSLEDVVHRMTEASCQRFGLRDRGILREGAAADVVVFDPETVADSPPRAGVAAARPVGIEHVFVNGTHVVADGAYVGARAGQVLRG